MDTLNTRDKHLIKQQQLAIFQNRAKFLLNDHERSKLLRISKRHHSMNNINRYVKELCDLLDTPAKMDLFKDIRNFIPLRKIEEFDALVPYERMMNSIEGSPITNETIVPRSLPGSFSKRRRNNKADKLYDTLPIRNENRLNSLRQIVTNGPADLVSDNDIRSFNIQLTPDNDILGISIRGGVEKHLGIYVSEVEKDSAAERARLKVGDHILEVNGINFKSITISSAINVLTNHNLLRMVVSRTGRVPAFRKRKVKIVWFDTISNKIIADAGEDRENLSKVLSKVEKRVHLHNPKHHPTSEDNLGFNIRGGSEYGIGIFVSKIDPGGIAELQGLRLGDQILEVNGINTDNLSHRDAVLLLRDQSQLVIRVRSACRFPIYKEVNTEYKWLDENGLLAASRSFIKSIPVQTPNNERSDKIRSASSSQKLASLKSFTPLIKPRDESGTSDEDFSLFTPKSEDEQAFKQSTDSGLYLSKRDYDSDYVDSVSSVCSDGLDTRSSNILPSHQAALDASTNRLPVRKKSLKKKLLNSLKLKKKQDRNSSKFVNNNLTYEDRGTSPINDLLDVASSHGKGSATSPLEIPKLRERRLSVLNDSEIISHPDTSSAKHAVEIDRMKSHSKYYRAHNVQDTSQTAILDERSPTPSVDLTETLTADDFHPTYNELLDALVSQSDDDTEDIFIEDQSVNAIYEDIQDSNRITTVATIENHIPIENGKKCDENNFPNEIFEGLDENEPVTSLRAIRGKRRPKFLNDTFKTENNSIERDLEEHFEKISMDEKNTITKQRLSNMSANSEITLENEIVEVHCPKKFSTNSRIIQIWKIKPTLGISISGGKDSKIQPEVRIQRIYEGGSAEASGELKENMEIVSVDGVNLREKTHIEAVEHFRTSFLNSKTSYLNFEVIL
ncbi:DgyrCDS13711 [Dimorphilus gyrociliatus]|uniref:DgyrCDS13711 n=1 Tax=Dimorphilus gyrociliatus TaxID=2664684 RepID=A0A7I8WBI8_9ANNE|nr:DgyrCDS13711 [Dimorphilus gyrociliatus]